MSGFLETFPTKAVSGPQQGGGGRGGGGATPPPRPFTPLLCFLFLLSVEGLRTIRVTVGILCTVHVHGTLVSINSCRSAPCGFFPKEKTPTVDISVRLGRWCPTLVKGRDDPRDSLVEMLCLLRLHVVLKVNLMLMCTHLGILMSTHKGV